MRVQVYGSDKNSPLLFLHGYGAHPLLYQNFVSSAAQDYQVYVPEIFGLRELCERNFQKNLDHIRSLIKEKNLDDAVLVGHSYGALAAMHLASEYPAMRRAVAVNPLLPQPFNMERFRAQWDALQRDLRFNTGELRSLLKHPDVGLRYGLNFFSNPLGYVEGAAQAIQSPLPQESAPVPVDIVYAELDSLFRIDESDVDRWKKILPVIHLIPIRDYSHNWIIYHGAYAWQKIKERL